MPEDFRSKVARKLVEEINNLARKKRKRRSVPCSNDLAMQGVVRKTSN